MDLRHLRVGDEYTVAYVLTNVRHDERVLMYRGFLKAFGLRQDGRFAYLVLTDVVRYFLFVDGESPHTTAREHWRLIGSSSGDRAGDPVGHKFANRRRASTYLVIEGEDVANVVFDRLEFDWDTAYTELLKSLRATRDRDLQAALRAILKDSLQQPPRN